VIYSTAAQSNKVIAIIGWFESTQTTAGTWAQAATATHTVKIGSYKTGDVVSHAIYNRGSVATFTDAIPEDDTIPQYPEGTEVMEVAYTLRSAANLLRVKSSVMMSSDSATGIQAALYRDAVTPALVAVGDGILAAGERRIISLTWEGVISATSTIIYTHAGATLGVVTINGTGGARYFGGVANTNCVIEEIWV
jgi:hypothetical protein